jgi:hypothetical protein
MPIERELPKNCSDCIFLTEADTGKVNIEACSNPDYADYSRMGRRVPRWADLCRGDENLCGLAAKGFKQITPTPPKPKMKSFLERLFQ